MALHPTTLALIAACALGWSSMAPAQPAGGLHHVALADLADLSLEELGNIVVESVSRRSQPLLKAPASIYVITGDEIRRFGATTLPEALRLAPNLQVAALDARQYAISARGFNTNIANKLLVMVDGRTIYSPLFSGVFWDAQDFVAADIDRIEVVSGPAGATWGTNAVNGVINVVTRSSADSLGPHASATLGNLEKTAVARRGFTLAEGATVRAHVKAFERGPTQLRAGGDANDAARGTFSGLRADWSGGADAAMLSAGLYRGKTDERPLYGAVKLSGAHLLGRWSRRLSEASDVDVQLYYDRSDRTDRFLLQEEAQIFDAELKYRHAVGRHRWLAGAGYRQARDRSAPGLLFAFLPPERRQKWYSVFVQDELALRDGLGLTLGTRFERNPYSGWETLPSVRLAYAPKDNALVWAALSRAVRSPARLDREIFTPAQPPFIVSGGPNFTSERANVAELGYRAQLAGNASWSVTAFVQDYDRLRSAQVMGGTVFIDNRIEGQVRGIEAWGSWQPRTHWRLKAGLLWLDHGLRLKPGSNDPVGPSNLGNDPRLQWSLRSLHSLDARTDLAIAIRRVGRLPRPEVPAYTATDLLLHWRARPGLQLSFGIRNAFDRRHVEYDSGASTGEIPRSAFVALSYQP